MPNSAGNVRQDCVRAAMLTPGPRCRIIDVRVGFARTDVAKHAKDLAVREPITRNRSVFSVVFARYVSCTVDDLLCVKVNPVDGTYQNTLEYVTAYG